MPGFNAEASLYKSNTQYRLATTSTNHLGQQLMLTPRKVGMQFLPVPRCRPYCGPCAPSPEEGPGCWQNCINVYCDLYVKKCTIPPHCDPVQPNPSMGPCLWQHCIDNNCVESWRPASGCTACDGNGFQNCRDAIGNCTTQSCYNCIDTEDPNNPGCYLRDCWYGGKFWHDYWCVN